MPHKAIFLKTLDAAEGIKSAIRQLIQDRIYFYHPFFSELFWVIFLKNLIIEQSEIILFYQRVIELSKYKK